MEAPARRIDCKVDLTIIIFVSTMIVKLTLHMTEIINNNLQELRKSRKITQEDLAQKIGITRQTIIAIEKGNYTPSVLLALKIAGYFKIPVENIFTIHHEN